jgi:PII-like signaling protein
MEKKKMLSLKIRIRKNDQHSGKRIQGLLMDLLIKNGVRGTTVWIGVDGFGKMGKTTLHRERFTVNMPLIIETVDEQSKLEPLISEIKRIVGRNGIMTTEKVYSI